ncbi:MAG TPA: TadE family type IV pilus minor pilin [Micromonosporaceae bacterium]|nr:TadE family type IV pilus minor pilin [Micromonosporaceae bacterium]
MNVRRGYGDRGSATAELATGLPALVLLLFAALTAVGAVTTQLRCVDAAREAALAVSRGEEGVDAVRRLAPDGGVVTVSVHGDVVEARATARVRPLGHLLPEITVGATAVAALEPGP